MFAGFFTVNLVFSMS